MELISTNKSLSLGLLAIVFCLSAYTATAYKFHVGGKDGWVVRPSEDYNSWAGRNRFLINDILYFKYKKGEDSVLLVNGNDYGSCNTKNPIQKWDDGETTVTLDRPGPFFFISGQGDHCQNGQKLIVAVLAVRRPPAVPATPPSTSAPGVPPPAKAPTTPVTSPPPSGAPGAKAPAPAAVAPVPSTPLPPSQAPGSQAPSSTTSPPAPPGAAVPAGAPTTSSSPTASPPSPPGSTAPSGGSVSPSTPDAPSNGTGSPSSMAPWASSPSGLVASSLIAVVFLVASRY